MRLSDFTGLGRAIDPHYPTNRAIALIVGAVVLAWTMATADIGQGLRAGLDVFFAWALCRELDPDHDLSAFLAAALVLAGLASSGASTGALFWLLLVVRVVNRTTGLSANLVDAALVSYLGVTSGWGVVTATAFALDALLFQGRKRQWLFATAALVASFWYPLILAPFSAPPLLLALSLGALFLPCVTSGRLTSVDDTTGAPLNPWRVRWAQLLALEVGTLGGLQPFLPLWAAIAAASLWRFGLWAVASRSASTAVRDLKE